MWANNVIAVVVRVLGIPLKIVALVTTLIGGFILDIPLVGFVFVLLLAAVWAPLFGLLLVSAWAWHYAPAGVRSLATVVGIPVAVFANTFVLLAPGAAMGVDMYPKMVKHSICQDWPYAYTVRDGRSLIQMIRDEEGINFFSAVLRWCDERTARQEGRTGLY